MCGLFTVAGVGCVYVPPDLYYGTTPRATPHRDYYIEEYYGPDYSEEDWYERRRREELAREERRGYVDQKRGRARADSWEDRYGYRYRRDQGEPVGPNRKRNAEGPDRRSAPPPLQERDAPRELRNDSSPSNRSQDTSNVEPRKTETPKMEKTEVPVGSKTSKPNRVKSPYSPHNELDITGLKSGSLARDPTTGKIFRVP